MVYLYRTKNGHAIQSYEESQSTGVVSYTMAHLSQNSNRWKDVFYSEDFESFSNDDESFYD